MLHNNELYCHVVKAESFGPTKNPMLIHVLLMIYSILKNYIRATEFCFTLISVMTNEKTIDACRQIYNVYSLILERSKIYHRFQIDLYFY